MKRYGLMTTHFHSSFVGTHYYVDGWVFDEDKGDYDKRIEKCGITRVLSTREAVNLNKKDGPSWVGSHGLKGGDKSSRFDDKYAAIEAGVKFMRKKYGEDIKLEISASSLPWSRMGNPIYGEPGWRKKV